jgi:cytochrome c-type biogenesis protein CcmH/NrfF
VVHQLCHGERRLTMPFTRAEEMAIRAAAQQANALAQSLPAHNARDVPDDVVHCPKCNGTDLAEAGADLVCADCKTNIPR